MHHTDVPHRMHHTGVLHSMHHTDVPHRMHHTAVPHKMHRTDVPHRLCHTDVPHRLYHTWSYQFSPMSSLNEMLALTCSSLDHFIPFTLAQSWYALHHNYGMSTQLWPGATGTRECHASCSFCCFSHSESSGYYMYHQDYHCIVSTFCPHSAFMCFVWIWEQTAIISLYSINWLVFITETGCVYCAVRSAYIVYLCVLCGSENKERLFHCTALTDWFL
jgi:hypothetical protein